MNLVKKIFQRFSQLKTNQHLLLALGPLDGRYQKSLTPLKQYFSEYALIKYRVKVEIQWIKYLLQQNMIKNKQGQSFSVSKQQIGLLDNIFNNFDLEGGSRVKQIQKITNHDVKAVQYYIKEKLQLISKLRDCKEYVHFCCTSEDINNLSYSLMLSDAKNNVLNNIYGQLLTKMIDCSQKYADVAMLCRTHGQPATPSTLGKQFANFTYRINKQISALKAHKFTGKLNGAVGNFNAHMFAYPEYNWQKLSQQFIEKKLSLQFNPYTTQIQSHDNISSFYNNFSLTNTILIGLNRDIWQYISLGYFNQKVKKNQIGSSTMPHKVNPIDFENCEGNLGFANAIMNHFSAKLPISRLQRDLSDSTVLRNQGLAFGYSIIGYKSLIKGLDKLQINNEAIGSDLENHYEVITQAVQTVLRKYGWQNPYELLKQLTRGKKFDKQNLKDLIQRLQAQGLNKQEIQRIKSLHPSNYLGNAIKMAKQIKRYL